MEEQNQNESSMPNQEQGEKNGGMVGKIIGLVVVVVVIALGVYALTRGAKEGGDGITPEAASTQNEESAEAPAPDSTVPETVVEGEQPFPRDINQADGSVTVVFTDSGYVPKDITVKVNQVVNFKNESAKETWPASAMHPTHTVYPGSDIQKCGTPEAGKIFDACRGFRTGETYSFQFGEVGKWNYHDHINAGNFGSITVTE